MQRVLLSRWPWPSTRRGRARTSTALRSTLLGEPGRSVLTGGERPDGPDAAPSPKRSPTAAHECHCRGPVDPASAGYLSGVRLEASSARSGRPKSDNVILLGAAGINAAGDTPVP